MKKAFVASMVSVSVMFGTLMAPVSSFAAPAQVPITQPIQHSVPSVPSKGGFETNSIFSNLVRKAIANGIRHGGPYLGNLLSKINKPAGDWVTRNSQDVARVLDSLTEWQEVGVVYALMQIGCPPDYAQAIAKALVAMVGV